MVSAIANKRVPVLKRFGTGTFWSLDMKFFRLTILTFEKIIHARSLKI
jgi:hypothetical protein